MDGIAYKNIIRYLKIFLTSGVGIHIIINIRYLIVKRLECFR
jgi:hypothetical protein